MGVKININKKNKIYLGIGGSNHDFSVCLLKNGKIINAIETERINRIKHSFNTFSPINTAFKYLAPENKISINSISSSDILYTYNWFGVEQKSVKYFNHHLCHAASTFFTSPFKEAAIFVCDGIGSIEKNKNGYLFETYSYYKAKNTKINLLSKNSGFVDDGLDETSVYSIDVPNSIGLFYKIITELIGFGFLEDGKTMGLSAYGNSAKYYEILKKYFEFKPQGIVLISFGLKEAREFYDENYNLLENKDDAFQFHADIAAGAQKLLEESYFYCLNYLYKITKCDNLCISGGVALNSVANGKITQNTPFKNIYGFPACGDAGTAIGAAYLSYYGTNKKRVLIEKQSPFLGKDYGDKDLLKSIKTNGIPYKKVKDVYDETAKLLTENKIVGWFQGGSEIGPRALGHRSIVVDPRKTWMKDYLNARVKKRESFRPFAPAILEEKVEEYFDNSHRSPYMLEVFPIKKKYQKIIPAVVHTDGTGRLQTVGPDNEAFYKLITSFNKLTGVPVILNTSFNINKMPIVETPDEAISCFLQTNIDVLVVGNYICTKPKKKLSAILLRRIKNLGQNHFLKKLLNLK